MESYGNYFKSENLGSVTQEGFEEFLLLKNNKHWSGIHRSSSSNLRSDAGNAGRGRILLEELPKDLLAHSIALNLIGAIHSAPF
jgi:hypothetical protein